jgi:serine kinase
LHEDTGAKLFKQHKIFDNLKKHPNIAEYLGLMMPNKLERYRGHQPDFIYEFIRQDENDTLVNNKALVSNILQTDYFDSIENTRSMFEQLLTALDYIHSKGIMHRDISPKNLLIDGKGVLKIIDFDFSEFVEPLTGKKLDTKVGSLGYRSPELFLK